MSNYSILLKPVYSCPADISCNDVVLPEGWQLSWHQLETWKALQDPDIDVVLNAAMTGDGKSLAAFLNVLQGDSCAIALYPTNELARDQENQIKTYIEKFQPQHNPRIFRLNSAELEVYAENEGLRKGGAIATLTGQREALLTNPDIFHYLHRGAYLVTADSPDKLWGKIDKEFDLFIFDEFHVFSAPQIASVINTMLLIRCTNRRKKYLFLSATPDNQLIERLEKAGFCCKIIDPVTQNKYQFPDTLEQSQQLETAKWRKVVREICLNFVSLEPSSKAAEEWLKSNSKTIVDYFQQHPGSKGAIVLNSIAAVKRLVPFFRELLQPYDLTVGENTGLSGKGEKERSLSADLVFGTSTIDVGVDFKINFLISESSDAGNFIQRLGRLGRHDGYERDGQEVKFNKFTAYALVSNFFVERLFEGDSPALAAQGIYDRIFLHSTIREKYRQINDFQGYYRRWGAVQSMQLCRALGHKTVRLAYGEGSKQAFQIACEAVFESNLKHNFIRSKKWEQEWLELSGKTKGNPILEDACSFRGSSPLQCGLYDPCETNPSDRFKTYDLSGILSNLEIDLWTKVAFMKSLEETAASTGQPIAKGRFAHCLAFMKLKSYREECSNWKFTYPGDLGAIADAWKVQVLTGIEIWQPNNRWASEINKHLRKEGLVCYVIRRPVHEVRMRLRLPMHFQIYGISDNYSFHELNAPYAIAFGQSALLLDTLAYRFKGEGGETWIV